MNDLERDVRAVLERMPSAPPRHTGAARSAQACPPSAAGHRGCGGCDHRDRRAAAVLVISSLPGHNAARDESPSGTWTSTVRGITLAYPAGWTLVELADEVVVNDGPAGPEGAISGEALLQLSNFDPWPTTGSCSARTSRGAAPGWGRAPVRPGLEYRGCPDRRPRSGPSRLASHSPTPSGRASEPCSTTPHGRSTAGLRGVPRRGGRTRPRPAHRTFASMALRSDGIDRDEILGADGSRSVARSTSSTPGSRTGSRGTCSRTRAAIRSSPRASASRSRWPAPSSILSATWRPPRPSSWATRCSDGGHRPPREIAGTEVFYVWGAVPPAVDELRARLDSGAAT